MYYFSLPYFFDIFVAIAFVCGLYFWFKNKSEKAKRRLLLALMIFNFLQHILKSFIYPHLWGEGFTGLNTAYNMCAFLILSTPFIYLFGSELWKNFIVYLGTASGAVAILVPYWFTVDTAFTWEAIRFYLCHILLILTSILPLLFGIYKINWRKCWRLPFLFFLALIIIVFNEIICFVTGLFDGGSDLFAYLKSVNPCWTFGPFESFEWVGDFIAPFTPDVFLPSVAGDYVPILWFALPLYFVIAGGALAFGAFLDKERFKGDIALLKEKAIMIKDKFHRGDRK